MNVLCECKQRQEVHRLARGQGARTACSTQRDQVAVRPGTGTWRVGAAFAGKHAIGASPYQTGGNWGSPENLEELRFSFNREPCSDRPIDEDDARARRISGARIRDSEEWQGGDFPSRRSQAGGMARSSVDGRSSRKPLRFRTSGPCAISAHPISFCRPNKTRRPSRGRASRNQSSSAPGRCVRFPKTHSNFSPIRRKFKWRPLEVCTNHPHLDYAPAPVSSS